MSVSDQQLAIDDYGDLRYINGELFSTQRQDDPVGFRGVGRPTQKGIVKFGGSVGNGSRQEVTYTLHKQDERTFGQTLAGEIETFVRAPGQSGADTRIETVRFDGVTYHVPIIAAAGIVGAWGGGDRAILRSPNGWYDLEMQDDGNLVIYDEQNGHTPIWSSGSSSR